MISFGVIALKKLSKYLLTTTAILMLSKPVLAMDANIEQKFNQMMAIIEAQNAKIASLEARLNEQRSPPNRN
jgi:hypothetical protein